jgi:hypothetical protein
MKKVGLTWRDFQPKKEGDRKRIIIEASGFLFFLYFLLSLASFWQYEKGDVPYSSFWHAPWIWVLNAIF